MIPSGSDSHFAIENGPVDIVSFPMKTGGSFPSYVLCKSIADGNFAKFWLWHITVQGEAKSINRSSRGPICGSFVVEELKSVFKGPLISQSLVDDPNTRGLRIDQGLKRNHPMFYDHDCPVIRTELRSWGYPYSL